MPTLLLLDVSLSMLRPVPLTDTTENHTRLTIASAAINSLLDHLNVHAKLEYVALVTFSSSYEVIVPFTRDYDSIRNKLPHLEEGDKTSIENALLGINQVILNEWGYQTPVQIILITDGSSGVGPIGRCRIIQALPLPPSYPAKIHILPVVSPHDSCLQQENLHLGMSVVTPRGPLTLSVTRYFYLSNFPVCYYKVSYAVSLLKKSRIETMPLYQKIIDMSTNSNGNTSTAVMRGTIYCPDHLSVPGAIAAMSRLCEQQYQEFWCSLKCGQLESRVQLFPPPQPIPDESAESHSLASQIHVVGFVTQQELGTPIAVSKHLIIPQIQIGSSGNRDNFEPKTPTKDGSSTDGSTNEEDIADPSKVPNFTVLLHGALKVEGMSAIVLLGADWWGTLSAWCEVSRARRSCLLLSVMRPGAAAAPWLGPLDQLGPAIEGSTDAETFPVRSWRSYSGGGGCAWAHTHALLADVQKVLRHARKLPDKTQHLYKELNRLRRAAISLGFSELLTSVGAALERECAALPSNAAPECALQLAHAAAGLRDPRTILDIKHTLQPLPPNFTATIPH